jgi:hypothetical protein
LVIDSAWNEQQKVCVYVIPVTRNYFAISSYTIDFKYWDNM